jgi:DNA-directed RNA polymerase III subunit RPC6
MYKASKVVEPLNHFTQMPCGVCPVIDRCEEGGEISPATCAYYTKWLEAQDGSLDF